ncbi:Uncharacterized protein Rs2_35504 [Raphanus sativus]|nr:Uncharacterized protein Rs2_35504 [Raphanus sativus]
MQKIISSSTGLFLTLNRMISNLGNLDSSIRCSFLSTKSLNYGKLSGQLLEHTCSWRAEFLLIPENVTGADFALWKADEPSWGLGRPGWHIQCSLSLSRCALFLLTTLRAMPRFLKEMKQKTLTRAGLGEEDLCTEED